MYIAQFLYHCDWSCGYQSHRRLLNHGEIKNIVWQRNNITGNPVFGSSIKQIKLNYKERFMLKKLLNSIGNISGIALFTFLCVATFQNYQKTQSIFAFSIVLVNCLILVLYLVRREPNTLIEYPFAWFISIAATLLAFLYRPIQEAILPELLNVGYYTQMIGALTIIGSLLSLRGSIGIVPANRGVKKGGFYRLVRHPLYAAELIFFSGYVLSNQSITNIVLLLLSFAMQYSRSRIEENFLINDPDYRLYMSSTRYRFIPGLL
jgi:protein-S-isoprenylcysteine O-methyltransferase Ste14